MSARVDDIDASNDCLDDQDPRPECGSSDIQSVHPLNPEDPEDLTNNLSNDDTNIPLLKPHGRQEDVSSNGNERSQRDSSSTTPSISSGASSRSSRALDDVENGLPRKSRPSSRHSTARSQQASSRSSIANEATQHDGDNREDVHAHDSSPFSAWNSPGTGTPSSPQYTIGPFVVLLLEEFCRQYQLTATAAALQQELSGYNVAQPDSALWLELCGQCQSILGNKKHSNPLAAATTIEKLVEFCVTPQARRAVLSLDMASAYSPVSVCASPKKSSSSSSSSAVASSGFSMLVAYNQMRSPIVRPSRRPSKDAAVAEELPPTHPPPPPPPPSGEKALEPSASSPSLKHGGLHSPLMASKAAILLQKQKKKKRKARQQRSQSVVSVLSHGSPQRDHHQYHHSNHHHPNHHPPQLGPGTYGEPSLVDAHMTNVKRDLTTTRLLEKELRNVRLEKMATEPAKAAQKRLGFRTLSVDEELTRRKLQDPYASELVLEKYGFSKRQDCALCQFAFLPYNLPHKVSFKCVMDVYDHWQYTPADRETASKYKSPLCYDAVLVCRMCAQIVFQHAKQTSPPELIQGAARPLSRKHKKAKSLANLHQEKPQEEDDNATFCSDPYALPPLLGDDVYDQQEALADYYQNGRRGRVGGLRGGGGGGGGGGGYGGGGGGGGEGDLHDGENPRAGMSEYATKAIIYSQQQVESARFMSAKEWDVINPDKSSTRHILQATLANTTTQVADCLFQQEAHKMGTEFPG